MFLKSLKAWLSDKEGRGDVFVPRVGAEAQPLWTMWPVGQQHAGKVYWNHGIVGGKETPDAQPKGRQAMAEAEK